MAFKRILCGVDFSSESLDAFRVAVETARLHSASLHVLHVIEAQPVVSELPPVHGMGEVAVQLVSKATEAVESLVVSAGPDLRAVAVTTEVSTGGLASEEILARARERKTDLVVVGARGRTSFEELIVGSTAERVTREASCSVLIVRP
jgi:universal stress protein A